MIANTFLSSGCDALDIVDGRWKPRGVCFALFGRLVEMSKSDISSLDIYRISSYRMYAVLFF